MTLKSCFHQLRLICKARHYVPHKDVCTYCNSLYVGLNSTLLHTLQIVLNEAAGFLTGTGRRVSITPVLADLHWLPVKYRIQFKIMLLTFRIINNIVPSYLTELLSALAGVYNLRSSSQFQSFKSWLKTYLFNVAFYTS